MLQSSTRKRGAKLTIGSESQHGIFDEAVRTTAARAEQTYQTSQAVSELASQLNHQVSQFETREDAAVTV